ncbi:MAG: AAA family ATPase [Prevotella sp.]|uniref:AAA family ATPase n=1 Tax=Leyella stercorea TaxID=363265 RepID=UPI0025CFAFA7|nr:AAA family ATPase [Prevotella sp.]MCI7651339.1 AAA family ATPase [Prevotella sp.]MDD7719899.1 AAA family ATPase [Leyella stercorea]MDY4197918.1 AAA family ATPase [Prevotella sp.]
MNNSKNLANAIKQAIEDCDFWRHEFVTPEHVLYAFASQEQFASASEWLPHDASWLITQLEKEFLSMEVVPETQKYVIEGSQQFSEMMSLAIKQAQYSDQDTLDVPHVVAAMLMLNDSQAAYLLDQFTGDEKGEFMQSLVSAYAVDETGEAADGDDANSPAPWRKLVTCVNDTYADHNPLIGREAELERTMQVLCRKDKNNPLHVGEPGVGKTALIYGLTALIERGAVPERLRGARVYMMDMGTMVAGTQFRGDFEKRIKMVMEGLAQEGNAILCIDEIHNLIGAGRNGDASLDASNMLKPYLESGAIRFIGSTTYDEYNRYIAKQKSLVRRFQQIDIAEPSVDDAIRIVEGLRPSYEKFHGVKYAAGVVEFAVRSAAKHIRDRFLPDKAIDLIDEAGAYRETHPLTTQKRQTVDRRLVTDILARVCKIDAEALKEQSNDALRTLEGDIKKEIFGQDEAVGRVVEAVQMSKAGLADDTKPMASLLFVGPTGVGKTEVARVLSERMGMKLVRFDMSEYAEKHAVAKLIGSPAGYVGYEDGGLLTAAVRKTPNCVLLFDEIEKAHPDIFNIFLQMMDYAALTDNHGERADFRNAIIIMTSNAGAQYASRASIGFTGSVSRGDAMLTTVKKTFKPEFINRLTDIVVFHDMSRQMASLILDKKLAQLQTKLSAKNVTLHLSAEARELLLTKGFTPEYGARELDRVIGSMLKPLLMREILFGKLKKGGEFNVECGMLNVS